MKQLSHEDRMRLMRFVCSFAWADLRITESERDFIHKTVRKLKLSAEEREMVEGWLKLPPPAEKLDPAKIPPAHRQLFIQTAREMIEADGEISEEEVENFELIAQLLT